MTKLIGCIMAGNSGKYINLCIRAVIDQVDKLVICYDTSSSDDTLEQINSWLPSKNVEVISRKYEHDLSVKSANSDQRNFYLEYLKENFMGDWCLVLDADEVVEDSFKDFKKYIPDFEKQNILLTSPKMEHFIGDLAHTDNTRPGHHVLHRLFKIMPDLFYPDSEHPVLQCRTNVKSVELNLFVIYHLAYCREMFYFKERYETHKAKSEMHTPDFLQEWYYAHLTGNYPKKDFDIHQLPSVLKDEFLIDDDFFYFRNRVPEDKHYLMAAQYRDYFKPEQVFCPGDGRGIFTHAFRTVGVVAFGSDLSYWAVKHNFVNDPTGQIYFQEDITKLECDCVYDLVCVMDVLEHLNKEDVLPTLKRLHAIGLNFLFSIPFEGDPNLLRDNTHKVFEKKEWWLQQLMDAGFKIEETPNHFMFKEQMVVCKK